MAGRQRIPAAADSLGCRAAAAVSENRPPSTRFSGAIEYQGYSIEKVLLETLPGYYLGGNLYRPLKAAPAGGFPAVLTPHGHWTYGRLEDTAICSVPARAINLARQGYVVLTYDMVGYNDSVQTPHDFGEKPFEQLWGFGSFGLQLWNSESASVDFLESLPGVNPKMIGATGASGGGTQTYMLTAVDDRIQFSAPANMVSFTMQGGGVCENAPGLRLDTNNVEFAAMMAPRPMFMAAATGDWTRNMLREEYPAVRAIYDLYGKGERRGSHAARRTPQLQPGEPRSHVRVLRQARAGRDGPRQTRRTTLPRARRSRTCWRCSTAHCPAMLCSFQQLFEEWVRLAKEQTGDEASGWLWRWPPSGRRKCPARWTAGTSVLGRPGRGDRIPGIWVKGSNTRRAGGGCRWRRGRAADAGSGAPAVDAGRSVLMIDAFQTGSAWRRATAP